MSQHKISTMNPEHYRYLGWIYQGSSEAILNSLDSVRQSPEYILPDVLREDEKLHRGRWYRKGTCDLCGARFSWGNVYEYTPTGKKVVVSQICAIRFGMASCVQLKQHNAGSR